jgi:D-sedoheptulose 7-phosphate isomerase
MLDVLEEYLETHLQMIHHVREKLMPQIVVCADQMITALRSGHKILIMGNGGSAADAQHFAAELVGRFRRERQGLAAVALSTDSSILTAIGNDYGFDEIFSRQIEALATPGDIVFGISTSGHSKNITTAIQKAEAIGCQSIGLIGKDGGELAAAASTSLIIPGEETSCIQEAHIMIIHMLCELIEASFASEESGYETV